MDNDQIIRLLLDVKDGGTTAEAATNLQKLGTVAKETAQETEKAATAHGNLGRGILNVQYAVDDFMAVYENQGFGRAIAAIQNNIPQIALAFGGTAGMAAGIGLVALAVGALSPAIAKMWNSFTGTDADEAKKRMEEAKDQLKEIEKAAEATAKAFEKMKTASTDIQKEAAENRKAYLEEPGVAERVAAGAAVGFTAKEVTSGMTEAEQKERAGMTAEEASLTDQLKQAQQFGAPPEVTGSLNRQLRLAQTKRGDLDFTVRKRLAETLTTQVAEPGLVGERAAERVFRMAGQRPGAFPSDLGFMMETFTPGAIHAEDARNAAEEEGNQRAHDRRMAREADAKVNQSISKEGAKQRESIFDLLGGEQAAEGRKTKHAETEAAHAVTKAKHDADHAMAEAKRQADHMAQLAKQAIQQRLEDAQYWMKFNAGQITMMDQMNRAAELQKREVDRLANGQGNVMAGIQQSLQGSALPR